MSTRLLRFITICKVLSSECYTSPRARIFLCRGRAIVFQANPGTHPDGYRRRRMRHDLHLAYPPGADIHQDGSQDLPGKLLPSLGKGKSGLAAKYNIHLTKLYKSL